MYCKRCGFKNSSESIYCLQDGALLKDDISITLENETDTFCKYCGYKRNGSGNYCLNCGGAFLKEATKILPNQINVPNKLNSLDLKNSFNLGFFKQGGYGALVSAGVTLLLCFIISAALSSLINEALEYELYELAYIFDMENIKLVSTSSLVMLVHFIGTSFSLTSSYGGGSLTIQGGIYLLLLVPFIALFLGGLFSAKKNPADNINQRVIRSLSTGLIYGLFLGIVSFFASESVSQSVPLMGSVGYSIDYSFFRSVFNGFWIGSLFSFLGSLIQLGSFNFKTLRDKFPFAESVYQGISISFKGLLLSGVLLLVLSIDNFESENVLMLIVGLTQGAVYLWGLLTLNTFAATGSLLGFWETTSFNIVSNRSIIMELFRESNIFMVTIIIGLVFTILLFLWAGRKIKQSSEGDLIKELAFFSGTYALVITLIFSLGNVSIKTAGSFNELASLGVGNINLGFSFFSSLVTGFCLSFAISFLGSYFTKNSKAV